MYIYIHITYTYIYICVTWKQKQPIVVSMHGQSEIPCLCQFVASKRFPFIAHIKVLMYPSKANKHKYVLINMVYHDWTWITSSRLVGCLIFSARIPDEINWSWGTIMLFVGKAWKQGMFQASYLWESHLLQLGLWPANLLSCELANSIYHLSRWSQVTWSQISRCIKIIFPGLNIWTILFWLPQFQVPRVPDCFETHRHEVYWCT